MELQSFGYFGLGTTNLEDWRAFGTGLIGFQAVERSRSLLSFRMDDRKQRVVVDKSLPEGSRFFGWELADAKAVDDLAAKLESARIKVIREPSASADARFVTGLISFSDPAGSRVEACYGPHVETAPFVPGRTISGFRTGPLGLGHAVLTVKSLDSVMPFYTDLLGFKLSDYVLAPFKA